MRFTRRSALMLLLACSVACSQGGLPKAHSEEPKPSLQVVERLTGGASAQEALPLLVVLHGLGDTPEAFIELYAELSVKARVIAVRAPDAWGEGSSWYPIDDPEKKPRVIAARAAEVAKLLSYLRKTRPTLGKPLVSGFSQGGVLSFAIASAHTESIAQAFPIAGALPSELWPKRKLVPAPQILAFHGEADRRIPLPDAEGTVRALTAQGASVTLKTYPGVGHAIPQTMRADLFQALSARLRQEAASLTVPK